MKFIYYSERDEGKRETFKHFKMKVEGGFLVKNCGRS